MSKHVLGARIIGAKASAEQQKKLTDDKGGGAIQLGKRVLKQRSGPRHPVKVKAAAAPVITEEVVGSEPTGTGATTASVETAPAPKSKKKSPKPTDAGLSENDIADMLADDPNRWDVIVETEAKRPEGMRPRVAQMALNAAPDAKKKPMADDVRAQLERIAGVGAKIEAEKLAKAALEAAAKPVVAPEAAPAV